MGFASAYLEKRALFAPIVNEAPDPKTRIIVVVPSYNEPAVTRLLDSLINCLEPECGVEMIVVINAPENASRDITDNNLKTFTAIEDWKSKHKESFFRLHNIILPANSIPGWGVGLARKTGMDEAVRRFDLTGMSDGVILNVDADCTVAANYFQSVENELLKLPSHKACSIRFEHPLSGEEYAGDVYRNIILYELHLRYYFQALAHTGYPYVFHTVGSAMAIKALPYIKAGGMNRKQAGEDFYFIQKVVSEGYFSLNSTAVYPSPRISDRVPFGTGATMGKLSQGSDSEYLTYNFQAFDELKFFFGLIGSMHSMNEGEFHEVYYSLPAGVRSYLDLNEWMDRIKEIKTNTTNLSSFKKRFFAWFNMFRIVKYLNFVHSGYLQKLPVETAASELLDKKGIKISPISAEDLLLCYRKLE